jgi:hypothetical protein
VTEPTTTDDEPITRHSCMRTAISFLDHATHRAGDDTTTIAFALTSIAWMMMADRIS